MNEKGIIEKITTDFYNLSSIPMGNSNSYDYLVSISYSICNMIKLLHKEAGNYLLQFIAEEIQAHSKLLDTPIPKGDNPFDEVAYKAKFTTGLDNDLKISLCEHIGDVLVDNDILR